MQVLELSVITRPQQKYSGSIDATGCPNCTASKGVRFNRLMRTLLLRLGLVLVVLATPPFLASVRSQEAGQQTIPRNVRTKVDPRYPELAKQYQLAGRVRLEVTVSPNGAVTKTHVLGGNPLLVGAALEAVKQWKYEPRPKETVEMVDFLFQFNAK